MARYLRQTILTAALAAVLSVRAVAGSAPLRGELVYATCNLPSCTTLALALYELSNATSSVIYDFPYGAYEDGYVADSILDGDELIISLQYDSRPQQGFLLSFNLTTRAIVSGFNASQCFDMWLDPSNADTILCLALEPSCDGGSQCTELRHISRSTHEDRLIASFLPNFAPYTVSALDTKRNLIYSTFGPLTSGHNVLATIDPQSGNVLAQPTFPISTAYIELEYDPVTDAVYGVMEDAADGAFVGTVDPATGAATPIGARAYLNTTQWNQFNTISTIAPEIGTLFFTAFHYGVPGPPPSDPILHLLGASLETGEIIYDEVLQNPFDEILWLASAALLGGKPEGGAEGGGAGGGADAAPASVARHYVVEAVRTRSARTRACCSLPVSLLMYGLFCVSFLFHASSPVAFTFETAIVSELVYGSDFANAVYSRESWAVWLRDAFVPLVLGLGDGTAGEDAQVIGGYALPLGGIRIRQTRQASAACPDKTAGRVYAGACYAGPGAGAVGDAAAAAPFGTPADAFAPSGLPGDPVLSYQLLLSTVTDLATAQAVVDGLVAGAWTDAGTRTLSVQVLLLNAQPGVDRWGVASFDASFEPGGLVRATTTVRSFPDSPYPATAPGAAAGAGFVLFIDVLLIVYALYVLAGTARRVATRVARARGCGGKASAALLDAWLVIDYFTTYFLWALIANWADFARQLAAVRAGIDGDGAASPAVYASGERKGFLVALLNAGATYAYARVMAAWALIFLAVRQFKYLQYQSRLAVMTQSIAMSFTDSAAFSLLLAIVLSMFGVWGVAMFGGQAADWQDSHVAITSIFRFMMYDYDLVAMEAVNVDMARLFFASYMLLVTNLILWMFLAIFLESYTDVRAASHRGNTVTEDAVEAAGALALRLTTCPPWRRGGCCSLVPHGIAESEAFLTALAADAGGGGGGAPRVTLPEMLAAARTAELAAPGPPGRRGGPPAGVPPAVVRALFAEALSLEAAAAAGITLPGLGGVSSDGDGDHATHVSRPPPPGEGMGGGVDPTAAGALLSGRAGGVGGGVEGRSALALRTVIARGGSARAAAVAAAAEGAAAATEGARLSGSLPPAGYGSI